MKKNGANIIDINTGSFDKNAGDKTLFFINTFFFMNLNGQSVSDTLAET